jgi:hypothetical protein
MDTDLVKERLEKAITEWNAVSWHIETLKVLMAKEERKALSNVKEPIRIKKNPFQVKESELDVVYAQAKAASNEQLEARLKHFYYYDEYLSMLARQDSLSNLIEQYSKHVVISQKEETKYITDKEMLSMFGKIADLKNIDKGQKLVVKSMREEFDSGTIQGKTERYEFFLALENIYNQNR